MEIFKYWSSTRRIRAMSVLLVFVAVATVPQLVSAQMSWDDVNSIVKNRAYYKKQCGSGDSSAQKQGVATGKLFMIGDSVTNGASSTLRTTFETRGFKPVEIDGVDSRRLSEGGDNEPKKGKDGISVLEKSKDTWKDAGVVVIALGTNGGINDGNIQKTLDIIKGANANAKIFWVNVGVDNGKRSSPLSFEEWNTTLQNNASKGYTVIDWATQVKQHPDYITTDGIGAHLTQPGKQAFADTIANTLTGAGSPTTWEELNRYQSLSNTVASAPKKSIFSRVKDTLVNLAVPTASAQTPPANETPKPAEVGNSGQETVTLRDKISQMLIVRVDTKAQAGTAARENVGGVYVREGGEMMSGDAIKEMSGKFKTPPIVSTDGEGGQVDALGKAKLATPLPSAKVLGTKSDEEVTKLVSEYAKKMKELGFTMDFAPVLDLDNPANPIIGKIERGFSSDPAAVTAKAKAFAKGLEDNSITPVYKHFPGHGNASGDSYLGAVTTPPLEQMKAADLKPYAEIAPTAKAIMMGHLNVSGLGDQNLPASINPEAIKLLRTDYKFNGVVMTDDLTGMKAITDLGLSQEQALEKAIMAGEDMLLTNAQINVKAVIDHLEKQAETNGELKKRIEESSTRILALKSGQIKQTGTGDNCSCGSGLPGASNLQGSENAEKIFNYFAGKFPGKPWIGAGFMGNMQSESGLNPRALQPGTTGDAPIRRRGYGLVQWTYEDRQKPLEEQAAAKGLPVYDLGLQLDYVIWELENKYKGVLDELQAMPEGDGVVEKATILIEEKYEVHGGGLQPKRVADAKGFFLKYASNSPTASASSGGSTCSTNSSGQVVGDFSLPLDKKWYDQHKDWFTKPHHDYPAADIPVPEGTPVYSMTKGTVKAAPNEGGYGQGVTIDAGNGVTFIYGHGIDGGSIDGAKTGDQVKPGQLIMNSGNTGQSQGAHLHLEIQMNGKSICPQNLFVGIVEGNIPSPDSLPTSGCSY